MRRRRKQRDEVRQLLAAVRAELAAQKQYGLEADGLSVKRPVVHLDELIKRARDSVRQG